MISAIQKHDDSTITLTVTIPVTEVVKAKESVLEKLAKEASVPGFRKGKAPVKMVAEKLSDEAVREEILKELLPKYYIQAVEEHNIKPIITPRIHIQKVDEGKDWQFVATTCEMPEIQLGDYKDKVKSLTAKSKIVIPGREKTEGPAFDELVKVVLENAKITVPGILIEQEVERLLSRLLDDIKRLGLTLDQYLASTNRNPETLRAEYQEKAKNDIMFEFVINKIAEDEKITVEPKEIEEAIHKTKDEKERKGLEANRYLLASILKQQKTLDFLKNL